jgi:hypothetical protein
MPHNLAVHQNGSLLTGAIPNASLDIDTAARIFRGVCTPFELRQSVEIFVIDQRDVTFGQGDFRRHGDSLPPGLPHRGHFSKLGACDAW